MAPTQRTGSRRSARFSFSAVNVEEQREELRRYEQEMKDLALAQSMQRENQAPPDLLVEPPQAPARAPNLVIVLGAPQVSVPAVPLYGQILASGPARASLFSAAGQHQQSSRIMVTDSPPRIMVTNSAPRIMVTDSAPHPPPGPTRQASRRNSRQAASHRNDPVAEFRRTRSSIVERRADRATNEYGRRQISRIDRQVRVITVPDDSSDEDSSNSMHTDGSDSTTNRSPIAPANRVPSGNQIGMDARDLITIDNNQPSTSRGRPSSPARVGTPDASWGDCSMCFEVPIEPQGCNRCRQIIGCKTCVSSWHRSSLHPSCPLCRREWIRKPDVSSMTLIDKRNLSHTLRRSQRFARSLAVLAE